MTDKNLSYWIVYIVQCADNTLYTGITNNLERRIAQHESGKGAKYTKGRAPLIVIHTEKYRTKGEALKREYQIKSLDRPAKLQLIK